MFNVHIIMDDRIYNIQGGQNRQAKQILFYDFCWISGNKISGLFEFKKKIKKKLDTL